MQYQNRFKFFLMAFIILVGINLNAQNSTKYYFKIGNIGIPLKLMNPPNGYNGKKELFKEDLLANIDKPIILSEDGAPMYGNKLMFYFLPNTREPNSNNTVNYTLELANGAKLPAEIVAKIKEKLVEGDNISIQSFNASDKISINSITLSVKDPKLPYRAPVNPAYNNENGIYNFQIVAGLPKMLIKFDSVPETNKKYLKIYSDKSKYEIMHIPGYKTKYRYIKPTDNPLEEIEINKTVNMSKLNLKAKYLYPEVAVDMEYTCSLNWGKMVANPVTQNQTLEAFNENRKNQLMLMVPKEHYTVIQFDMIIVPDRGDVRKYICEDISDVSVQQLLDHIEDRTMIYIQNIMVKNDANQIFYVPMHYGYPVAAK